MNKLEIQKTLFKYNFDKQNYVVITEAALVLNDMKEEAEIIDIAVTKNYFDYLIKTYKIKNKNNIQNEEEYYIEDKIKFSTNYYDKKEIIYINDIPVQNIEKIKQIKQKLNRKEDIEDLNKIDMYLNLNPLVLAYLGDSVYELYIRKYMIDSKILNVKDLQKESIKYVSAKGQAKFLQYLIKNDLLEQKELDIIKKGRNSKSHKSPKNTDILTYKHSTGFETLIGYLYLFDKERLQNILEQIKNI